MTSTARPPREIAPVASLAAGEAVSVVRMAIASTLKRAGIADFASLVVLSVALAAVLGAIVGAFMVRYRAIFFAMLNLAASMVFYALLSKLYGITGGTDGMPVPIPSVFGIQMHEVAFKTVLFYLSVVKPWIDQLT